MARILGFPNPVNEKAARVVAGGVLLSGIATVLLGALAGPAWLWLTVPLAAGFVARVLTGPKLSPLGQLATRVVAPRLGEPKLVPGPPKRFAQLIGAALTVSAVILQALGLHTAAFVLLGLLIVAAGLESLFAVCLGCIAFAGLMRAGVIPAAVCAECADISRRQPQPA